jgi:hypothetical protein
MLNSKSLLLLISTITLPNAANLSVSTPNEHEIQRYTTIANDPAKGLPLRLWNANLLLNHQRFDAAAAAYNSFLSDPKCIADLEWTLLAAEGLADCGDEYKPKALVILWKIVNNPSASDELKETATEILNKAQSR